MLTRWLLGTTTVVITFTLPACGGGEDSSPAPQKGGDEPTESQREARRERSNATPQRQRTPSPRASQGSPARRDPLSLRREAVRPKISPGRVIRRPFSPSPTQTRPSRACTQLRLTGRGGRKAGVVTAPPAPGARARRIGDRAVVVTYRFRSLPADCRPARLHFVVDVSNDDLPGYSIVVAVTRTSGRQRLRLPATHRNADTVLVSAVDGKGLSSRSRRIRITA